MPQVDLTTMVMIQNPETGEVIVQNRKRKWLGWSFPGGKVEYGESFYDCAVREVKEETGLDVCNLKSCGVLHWFNKDNGDSYLVFLYKTTEYTGELITDSPEGDHFWYEPDALFSTPDEKFSNEFRSYFPLFFGGKYSEALICWSDNEQTRDVIYR